MLYLPPKLQAIARRCWPAKLCFTFGLLCLTGTWQCFSVTTVNIGSKTSLERQLMGELEQWQAEELSSLAVRAGTSNDKDVLHVGDSLLLQCRARQIFRQDDILALKQAGCVGESLAGTLLARPCIRAPDEPLGQLSSQLVAEENADRMQLWALLQQQRPQFQALPLEQLGQLYGQYLAATARPGDYYLNAGQQWQQLSETPAAPLPAHPQQPAVGAPAGQLP